MREIDAALAAPAPIGGLASGEACEVLSAADRFVRSGVFRVTIVDFPHERPHLLQSHLRMSNNKSNRNAEYHTTFILFHIIRLFSTLKSRLAEVFRKRIRETDELAGATYVRPLWRWGGSIHSNMEYSNYTLYFRVGFGIIFVAL